MFRYDVWFHLLRHSEFGKEVFVHSSNCISMTAVKRKIDFYKKHYYIVQILIKPSNIQNPPSETDCFAHEDNFANHPIPKVVKEFHDSLMNEKLRKIAEDL